MVLENAVAQSSHGDPHSIEDLPREFNLVYEKKTDERINRLVAKAFIPNPENKPDVHHIDTNRNNNDVSNLVWLTDAEHHKAHRLLKKKKNNG